MTRYAISHLTDDEHHALRNAIVMGALCARQETLRTLVLANRGNSIADAYEAELRALQSAAHAVVDAKPIV